MSKPRKTRTSAREHFMQMLFEMDIQNDFSAEKRTQFEETYLEQKPEQEYFDAVFDALSNHLPEVDEALSAAASNWTIERFSKVDLAILRLAVLEIRYVEAIPEAVSINEAVELAKKYGTEESPKFINGVLGKIVRG